MNTLEIATQAIPVYGLDTNQPPVLLRDGTDNDVYTSTLPGGKRVVLRVSKRGISDVVDFEVKAIDFLSKNGVPVPKLILTKGGDFFSLVNKTVVVVFEFSQGTSVAVEHNTKPNAQYAYIAGEALGGLHRAGLSFSYRNTRRRTIFTEYERALSRKNFISNLDGGLEFLAMVEKYQDWAKTYSGPSGIIHNDYIPGNILFQNDSVSAILDFDWSCLGPLIKDLGIALATWSLPDGLTVHWGDILETFLDGYNKKAPQKILLDETLYRWISFSCLSDACTFLADLPVNTSIKRTSQCRRYMKSLYFEKCILS